MKILTAGLSLMELVITILGISPATSNALHTPQNLKRAKHPIICFSKVISSIKNWGRISKSPRTLADALQPTQERAQSTRGRAIWLRALL